MEIMIETPKDFLEDIFTSVSSIEGFKTWMEDFRKGDWQKRRRMIRKAEKNAEEILEEIPEPLKKLLYDVLSFNIQRWIENKENDGTIGQEDVLRYGFTSNQRKWIGEILNMLKKERPEIPDIDKLWEKVSDINIDEPFQEKRLDGGID